MWSPRSRVPGLRLWVCLAACTFGAEAVTPHAAAPQAVEQAAVSADVTIQHRTMAADGTPLGIEPPPIRYRWHRAQRANGWKTTITLIEAAGPFTGRRPQEADDQLARLEIEGDGTPPRLYNRRGELMPRPLLRSLGLARARHLLPSSAQVAELEDGTVGPRVIDRDWVESFVATPSRLGARRARLAERFARPTGTIGGLQRFVRTEGDTTEELLVHPDSALAVEVSVAERGRLVWHARFGYVPGASGTWLRRTTHAEQAVSHDGRRLATDVEFSNLRVHGVDGGRP
jgi:hypothetical protein